MNAQSVLLKSEEKKAFVFLEDKVQEGKIKAYGISSNTFIHPKEEKESTDFSIVLDILKEIPNHHFKYIQFPLNLLEMGALERQFDGLHLIELAQENNMQTIIAPFGVELYYSPIKQNFFGLDTVKRPKEDMAIDFLFKQDAFFGNLIHRMIVEYIRYSIQEEMLVKIDEILLVLNNEIKTTE